jgi:hypothetical protein
MRVSCVYRIDTESPILVFYHRENINIFFILYIQNNFNFQWLLFELIPVHIFLYFICISKLLYFSFSNNWESLFIMCAMISNSIIITTKFLISNKLKWSRNKIQSESIEIIDLKCKKNNDDDDNKNNKVYDNNKIDSTNNNTDIYNSNNNNSTILYC